MKKPTTKEFWLELADFPTNFWIIRKRPWLKSIVKIFASFLIAGFVLSLLAAICGIAVFGYMYFYTGNLIDSQGQPIDWEKIRKGDFKKSSFVLAANNEEIYKFSWENRDPIKLNEIPDLVPKGFIDAEDENFWIHPGIDPFAIGRALVGNKLREYGIKIWSPSGGSTIPVQLSRLMWADEVVEFNNRARTYSRKFTEARFAIQLVKQYPREELLAAYLNMPYFGHGAYGVAEAWRRYFGESIRNNASPRINLIQKTAVLTALNKSAEKYCPIFHEPLKPEIKPEMTKSEIAELQKKYEADRDKEKFRMKTARARWNWVLYQMREEGDITNEEYRAALFSEEFTEDNLTKLAILKVTSLKNPDFGYGARMVKEMLMFSGYKDEDITSYGGFRIKTCVDAGIQKILNEELSRLLAELNEEVEDKTNPIDGSAVMIEVKTGCISALIGGHDYVETPYDRAMALRSVGSAYKPFVYATAFENGKTFDDCINNLPFRMRGANGKPWVPQNFKEDRPVPFGCIPIYVGQIRSVNLPTLRLAMEIGMDKIVDTTHRMGVWGVRGIIKDPQGKIIFQMPGVKDTGDGIVPLLPTAIGASDVNLLELVNGYAVFFRGGLYLPPKLILEVKDQDGKLQNQTSKLEFYRSISEETTLKELILMRATTKVGTAKISMRDIEQQVACKTGTSNNPNEELGDGPGDVSIICGTPELVMGIRIGHDLPRPIVIPRYMKRASGRADMQVSGGWVAGPLSRRIWDKIYAERPKAEFPPEVETSLQELLAVYPEKYK